MTKSESSQPKGLPLAEGGVESTNSAGAEEPHWWAANKRKRTLEAEAGQRSAGCCCCSAACTEGQRDCACCQRCLVRSCGLRRPAEVTSGDVTDPLPLLNHLPLIKHSFVSA